MSSKIDLSIKKIIPSEISNGWTKVIIVTTSVLGSGLILTYVIRRIYYKTVSDLVNEAAIKHEKKEKQIKISKSNSLKFDSIEKSTLATERPSESGSNSPSDTSDGLEILSDNNKLMNKPLNRNRYKDSLSGFSLTNRPFKRRNLPSLASYQLNLGIENPHELIIFGTEHLKKTIKLWEDSLAQLEDKGSSQELVNIIEKTRNLVEDIQNYTNKKKSDNELNDKIDSKQKDEESKQSSPEGSVSSYYSMSYFDVEPNIHFFKMYINAIDNMNEIIIPRVNRAELVKCENDDEFFAKVHCLRQAFEHLFKDKKIVNFIDIGENILKTIITQSEKDQKECLEVYHDLVNYVLNIENHESLIEELKYRSIPTLSFYDLVIDYILLDSFEDLEDPPSSVLSVANQRWVGDSFKIKALKTVIKIVIKHKRSKMKINYGFYTRFYNILEQLTPILAWGFFGNDTDLKFKCNLIKQAILEVIRDYFDFDRVRFTNVNDLAEDILLVTDIRYDDLLSKLSILN